MIDELTVSAPGVKRPGCDTPLTAVPLSWRRFPTFIAARDAFTAIPCIYVQTGTTGRAMRVGEASKGLEARYRGGTGYALDATMQGSANLVFVAEVPAESCGAVEDTLIWRHQEQLVYNNQGKRRATERLISVDHGGLAIPGFDS